MTRGLEGRCSIHLSYGRKSRIVALPDRTTPKRRRARSTIESSKVPRAPRADKYRNPAPRFPLAHEKALSAVWIRSYPGMTGCAMVRGSPTPRPSGVHA